MTGTTKKILEEIAAFREYLNSVNTETIASVGEKEYILLLSGISSCRRIPGIPENMGYKKLYFCKTDADKTAAKEHLARLFDIHDMVSLMEACKDIYCADDEYEQFKSFWDGKPEFDINELNPNGRSLFNKSKDYAEHFQLFVGESGFYGWDCNERIGLCRKACACGIITEEEFWNVTEPMARKAGFYFHSWNEYAVSCLCGATYFMFREQNNEDVSNFFNINLDMLHHLFEEGGAWARSSWFTYPSKNWAIPVADMKQLLVEWDDALGCIATDRILVDGCKVGYMYREEPDGDWDSGWRFTSADESDEYMDNPGNSGLYELNTLCNSDPEIIQFLTAPYGSAYMRDEDGIFQEVEYETEEEDEEA